MIKLFGYLDPVYGHGYSEENDYILRANRKGFASVLAPRAFVAHIGEQSFAATGVGASSRDERNRIVLLGRYPEFETAVDRYFASPEAQVRRVVERHARSIDVMIDASTLPVIANGTSALAREMIPRLVQRLGNERCAVRGSADQLRQLGLADFPGLRQWEPGGVDCAKVGLRLSQPYSREDLDGIARHATKVVVFMLDTISEDCLYLQDPRVHALWDWVATYSDAVIYNSPYSMAKYQRRFTIDPDVLQRASYHSLNVDEYRPAPCHGRERSCRLLAPVPPHHGELLSTQGDRDGRRRHRRPRDLEGAGRRRAGKAGPDQLRVGQAEPRRDRAALQQGVRHPVPVSVRGVRLPP